MSGDSTINIAKGALVRSRDGFLSERATGLPVLAKWREDTLALIEIAIAALALAASESVEELSTESTRTPRAAPQGGDTGAPS